MSRPELAFHLRKTELELADAREQLAAFRLMRDLRIEEAARYTAESCTPAAASCRPSIN